MNRPDPAAYVSALQGRPWSTEQHCWHLVAQVQRDLYGRDLPAVELDDKPTALQLVRKFNSHPERVRWHQVTLPHDGAVVLLNRPGSKVRAIHAGVYLDLDRGGVLHVDDPHGVTFDSLLDLQLRNWRCEFYLPR